MGQFIGPLVAVAHFHMRGKQDKWASFAERRIQGGQCPPLAVQPSFEALTDGAVTTESSRAFHVEATLFVKNLPLTLCSYRFFFILSQFPWSSLNVVSSRIGSWSRQWPWKYYTCTPQACRFALIGSVFLGWQLQVSQSEYGLSFKEPSSLVAHRWMSSMSLHRVFFSSVKFLIDNSDGSTPSDWRHNMTQHSLQVSEIHTIYSLISLHYYLYREKPFEIHCSYLTLLPLITSTPYPFCVPSLNWEQLCDGTRPRSVTRVSVCPSVTRSTAKTAGPILMKLGRYNLEHPGMGHVPSDLT